jgi:serine/threonine-protein kinase
MIGKQIEKYTIISQLGQGGMATVYLANDNKFDTRVAIKILNKVFLHNDNIRKRFIAEARNMYKMSHPNIIKVIDLIDEGDTVAFVMEHIEGETLKEYLEHKGKLSDNEIKNLFSQMLDAVGYVHEQNLVHRDIKPSNFIITPKGQIKLLDFGIAKNTDSSSAEYTQTGTTQNMGTPMYMSPEQVKSTKHVTLKSDIYSLGVVLWQMVMGKKPYDTNTTSTFELQMKIVQDELPSTSKYWDSIIQKATAKDVLNRYETCLEIKKAMDKLTKKSKGSKVEDKTILVNTNENTFVEPNVFIEKEPEDNHKKSNLESREINNYIISPEIIITNTSSIQSKKTNRNYVISGIIVLIVILGLIIARNNNSNTQEHDDKPIDTSNVLVDSVATEAIINDAPENEKPVAEEQKPTVTVPAVEVPKVQEDILSLWMTNNLSVSTFRNGDQIPYAGTDSEWEIAGKKGEPAWCYPNNNSSNGNKF